jgi:hypothetical protein
MQICGWAEGKFASLKTDWERFIPNNIFFGDTPPSVDWPGIPV